MRSILGERNLLNTAQEVTKISTTSFHYREKVISICFTCLVVKQILQLLQNNIDQRLHIRTNIHESVYTVI